MQENSEEQVPGWQGFVYLMESDNRTDASAESAQTASATPHSQHTLPLSRRQVGDRVRITELNCGDANNRLMGMGFIPGCQLEIISCTATGSVIVALGNQRLGLGADMASKIQVTDIQVTDSQVTHANPHSGAGSDTSMQRMATMQTGIQQTGSEVSPVKLRDVAVGTRLRVIRYEPAARDYKRKLLAMGLTPGTELQVTRHAPLGDPTEIMVRGFQLSLRKAEADALIVVPITEN